MEAVLDMEILFLRLVTLYYTLPHLHPLAVAGSYRERVSQSIPECDTHDMGVGSGAWPAGGWPAAPCVLSHPQLQGCLCGHLGLIREQLAAHVQRTPRRPL